MIAPQFSEVLFRDVAQQLPAAPRLLVEIGQLIRRSSVSADEVVARLRQDAALVSRIIRVANSAVFARVEPVGSIEEAVAAVGFSEVHRLIGAVASAQLADQPLTLHGVSGARLRENSLFVGVLMEELAAAAGEDSRNCYTVGLLRSIGKLVLECAARREGATIPTFAESGETALAAWEQRHWGINNCDVAGLVLAHWRLPHETVMAIEHHYEPTGRHNPVTHLLTIAAAAAQDRFYSLPGEESYLQVAAENFRRAGLDDVGYRAACERAQRTFERLHAAVM